MQGKTNIIFLDCDGVINNDAFIAEWQKAHGDSKQSKDEFCCRYFAHNGHNGYVVPELVKRLNKLCDDTNCRIVWSSSWRQNYLERDADSGEFRFNYHEIASLWKAKGFPLQHLIGCTPCEDSSRFSYVPRGAEIQMWLDENAARYNVCKCAILDDNEDAFVGVTWKSALFFQTELELGLTREIAEQIKNWFNGVSK